MGVTTATAAPDVVIVGAGAGGAGFAWRLVQHGVRVRLLDAGPRFDPAHDYRLAHADWERHRFPDKPGSQGQTRFAPLQPLDDAWSDLYSTSARLGRLQPGQRRVAGGPGYFHVRGIGGSTLHFTGEAHRLHPDALRLHSLTGHGADWPLRYAELEPYYAMAERILGVAGPDHPGARWRSTPYPLPPHRLCRASQHLARAGQRLGQHWQANARAALSEPYDGRPACNYCGNCARGCPLGDKGSADVTFIRQAAQSPLLDLVPNARVTRIDTRGRRVTAVHYIENGTPQRVETPTLVLACGAIETPRLLLDQPHAGPTGLANGSGQVGRNLMETLYWMGAGLVEAPLHSYAGLPADAICWDFNAPTAIPGVAGGCRLHASTQEIGLVGPIAYASRLLAGHGAALKTALRRQFGHALAVSALGESLPNAGTFVDLDPAHRDAHGRPLARIHARLDSPDLHRLRFMAQTGRAVLQEAGADPVEVHSAYDTLRASHVFGTCRMGNDPQHSVVDRHQRAHDLDNLVIADASVFPSSGGGEAPSLSIEALALRAADCLVNGTALPASTPPATLS